MRDYYSFGIYRADVGGRSLAVVGKPGVWSWDRLNPGTRALLEVAEISSSDSVLDLGCGTGVIGLYAARTASRVVLIDSSLPAHMCASRTMAQSPNPSTQVMLADGVRALEPASFDVVLCHLPRGRAVQEELLDGAAWVLRPGGRIYLVASTHSGIKGAIRHARSHFGRCAVLRQKQGYHVAVSVSEGPPAEAPGWRRYTCARVTYDGVATDLMGKPGVFAWDRVDDGTAALVSSMEIGACDHILDLGCGTGLVGLAAARRAPSGRVVLVDGDVRAVEAARLTLEANNVTNAEAVVSDCAQAVGDRTFDVVVTNPPFHRGIGTELDVAHQFVRDARAVLRRGGRFYLVANRHLRYDDLIESIFGAAATVFSDNRYQVLKAVAR